MNICIFGGNLVRKPELKQIGSEGVSVVNFTIAVNRKFNNRDGEPKQVTTYINCEAWDTGAEAIYRYCDKGDYLIVYTSAKSESWVASDGSKRYGTKFRVDRFEFVPGVNKKAPDEEPEPQTAPNQELQVETDDTNIPF